MSKGWGVPNAILTMHDAFRLVVSGQGQLQNAIVD